MTTMFDEHHDYEYPDGVNLHPNSDTHKKLLSALNDRIKRGYNTMQSFREQCRKLDHLQTAYVPESTSSVLDLARDSKAPVSVVIPASRANLDIMTAYAGGVMMGDPTGMYNLAARGDKERMVRAAKMDRLLNMQALWFQHKLSHFTALRDTFLYGLSCRAPVWTKHKRREAMIEEVTEVLYELLKGEVDVDMGDLVRFLEERVYHEGNRIENIDVYAMIIDPYATLNKYQEAEFIGYWTRTHSMGLMRREPDPEERLFNCKYVRKLVESKSGTSTTQWLKESGRNDKIGDTGDTVPGHEAQETTTEVDVAYLYWHLIPREWGLGDSNEPELYAFAVAADEVIIQCHSLDYDHGMLPLVMDGPQTCGYELTPVSSLAAAYGMHQFMDWKVRVHYWNASAVQNNMFVIDGSAVNADDFKRGGPGKLIRLLRPLFGTDTIDKFIKQLPVTDVTNDYMQHIQGMMDFNNHVLGTQDITAGDMSGMPERPTQWGLQNAQQNAFSRLQKDCEMITEQAWYTLIRQQAHNNVQFLEHEVIVDILGSRFEQQLRDEMGLPPSAHDITIDPWDLDMGSFEIQAMNRREEEANMQVISQTIERIFSVPEIAMDVFGGLDVQRMFLQFLRKNGFKNVHEFRKEGGELPPMQGQVMPDEQIMAEEQAGNLVPAGAMM